jgi:Bardet-Biedl syndrome 4 protein
MQAVALEADHLVHLNYAVSLFNGGQVEKAREQFTKFEAKWAVRDWFAIGSVREA